MNSVVATEERGGISPIFPLVTHETKKKEEDPPILREIRLSNSNCETSNSEILSLSFSPPLTRSISN